MKTILTTLTCLLFAGSIFAQNTKIVTGGTIEYEKRINMHTVAKHELGDKPSPLSIQSYEAWKKNAPQFAILKSTLIFNDNKSLFTPIPPQTPVSNYANNPIGKQFNMVYTDMNTSSTIAQKEIYGDLFLVKDSIRKMTWRLTDETQEVAGYICRRANGLILDSVYVVAFYTDKIWVSSGPESFAGLPGMILKVALPYENVTWTATKVTVENVPVAKIIPPKKGKVITTTNLIKELKVAMKNWGSVGPYEMKIYLL